MWQDLEFLLSEMENGPTKIMLSLSLILLFPPCVKQCGHKSSEIPLQASMVRIWNDICDSSQAAEWSEPAGVFCQRQQQWQRQRCRGHQDRDQSGHTAVPCGMHAYNCRRCMRLFQPCRTCSLQLRLSPALNMTSPASRAPLPLQSKQSSSLSDRDTAEEDSDPLDDCGGFWRVQRRLQEEARVALALARPMARMQVEVERQIQLHRRSPVADLVSQWEGKTTPGICCCWWKAFFLPKTDCFLKFIYIEKFV